VTYYPSEIRFDCNEPTIANSEFCIFHDEEHYSEHKQEAVERFKEIVIESISKKEPLRCIGYYLPAINFAKLIEAKRFEQLVNFHNATFYEGANFSEATFSKRADFLRATFTEGANFSEAKFLAETYFLRNTFGDKTLFKYAIFGEPSKVIFDDSDLSSVSFAGSNGITTIRFGDKIKWRRVKNEVTIIEEEWLKDKVKAKNTLEYQDVSLDLVLTAYRNLRENFEFRLKFDESGKLFIREMELKRNYRHLRPNSSN
jgi:hypothetical protein